MDSKALRQKLERLVDIGAYLGTGLPECSDPNTESELGEAEIKLLTEEIVEEFDALSSIWNWK